MVSSAKVAEIRFCVVMGIDSCSGVGCNRHQGWWRLRGGAINSHARLSSPLFTEFHSGSPPIERPSPAPSAGFRLHAWRAGEYEGDTAECSRDTPECGGDTPEYLGDTLEYGWDTLECSSDTPEQGGDTVEYSGDPPEYGGDTPECSGHTPEFEKGPHIHPNVGFDANRDSQDKQPKQSKYFSNNRNCWPKTNVRTKKQRIPCEA